MQKEPQAPRYNAEAVEAAIAQARRKAHVGGREARMIHALLKGHGK
jgi:hypothetical protein